MRLQIHYADEWAALYRDGKLVEDSVGDSYIAEEKALALCGVERVYDTAFIRGGTSRESVAPTLAEVDSYRQARDEARAKAKLLREEAEKLLTQADALESRG